MSVCSVLHLGGVAGIVGPMLIYILGMGMVTPNAIAAAMEPVPRMAGFASSLIGCLQTAGGSLIGYAIGALYDRTALPMALAFGSSAELAGVTYFGFLGSLTETVPVERTARENPESGSASRRAALNNNRNSLH
jgi:MFS transporter, DHA1 family, multidrug resistance protein